MFQSTAKPESLGTILEGAIPRFFYGRYGQRPRKIAEVESSKTACRQIEADLLAGDTYE